MGDFGAIHEAIHGLVVFGIMKLVRQGAAGMAIDSVRQACEALGSSLVSQNSLAKMLFAEACDRRPHDSLLEKRWKPTVISSMSGRSRGRGRSLGVCKN